MRRFDSDTLSEQEEIAALKRKVQVLETQCSHYKCWNKILQKHIEALIIQLLEKNEKRRWWPF
jgi:hypothetical protein